MTSQEVQEALNISRMTLCNYVKAGKIKVKSKLSNRKLDYDIDSVNQLRNSKQTFDNKAVIYYNGNVLNVKLTSDKMDKLMTSVKKILDS